MNVKFFNKVKTIEKGDNSILYMNSSNLEEFGLFRGDCVRVLGFNETISVVLPEDTLAEDECGMNNVLKNNVGIDKDDVKYQVTPELNIKYLTTVTLSASPATQDVSNVVGYFKDAYLPVHVGDSFSYGKFLFTVTEIDQGNLLFGIVAPDTKIVMI